MNTQAFRNTSWINTVYSEHFCLPIFNDNTISLGNLILYFNKIGTPGASLRTLVAALRRKEFNVSVYFSRDFFCLFCLLKAFETSRFVNSLFSHGWSAVFLTFTTYRFIYIFVVQCYSFVEICKYMLKIAIFIQST